MSTAVTAQRAVRLEFTRRPSALRYMAGALLASRAWNAEHGFPAIVARWSGYRTGHRELDDFLSASGKRPPRDGDLPLLFPHTIGFRLQMAVLTHPRFPVPIWRVLQVRNQLLQHRPIGREEVLDFETGIGAHRVLEKGLEVDLHTTVSSAGQPVWESVNTFYVRGRYGAPGANPPLPQAPAVGPEIVAAWRMPSGARLRFGSLTGDYNGVHLWGPYARRMGFAGPFLHTQRVLGHCLSHLGFEAHAQQRLDTWLKGPVYYGGGVRLCAQRQGHDTAFALFGVDEQRPAIVGRVRKVGAPAVLQ